MGISQRLIVLAILLVCYSAANVQSREYDSDVSLFPKWKLAGGEDYVCSRNRTLQKKELTIISDVVQRSIAYSKDTRGDYWQSAEETIFRSAGDCEDKAILKLDILQSFGHYDAEIVIVKRKHDNMLHAVLWVFLDSEEEVIMDESTVITKKTFDKTYVPIYAIGPCGWRVFHDK